MTEPGRTGPAFTTVDAPAPLRSTPPGTGAAPGVVSQPGAAPPRERRTAQQRETSLLAGVTVPAVPELALPRGGGAIRGLGETFQVSAATGTGSLSVPIGLTPGRGGLTPALALAYDSGRGNGAFGLGWSLGNISIARRSDRRLPRYDDEDVFVLAGAEDLVAAPADEPTVRPDQARVRRFRPRVDVAFSRIERHTGPDGIAHWRVTTRDNQTMIFGRTPQARVADPDRPGHVVEWLLEEQRDDKGNVVSYRYRPEDTVGVAAAAVHEQHRLDGRASAARLLKSVRYGNAVPDVAGDWQFELVLDYGDHDPTQPAATPDRPWPVRPDPFSSYRAGFEVRLWRRCQRLLMFHRIPGAGVQLVRSTELSYVDNPTGSLLASVTRAGWRHEHGPLRMALPPLRLRYTAAEIDPVVRELTESSAENLPIGLAGAYTFVDLDGEGLAGILTDAGGCWYYKRNLGGGRFEAVAAVPTRPEPGRLTGGRQQLLDLAGDGRRSLAAYRPGLAGFFDRTEAGDWEPFVPFAALPTVDWNDPRLRWLDLTGDGTTDLLCTGDDAFTWYAGAGRSGFGDRERVAVPADEDEGPRLVLRDSSQVVVQADMSGDGLLDLVRVRNDEICYWPNLGYGRFGARVTLSNSPVLDHPDQFEPSRVRLADVDGCGPADLIYLHRDAIRLWFNESGNSFGSMTTLPDLPHLTNLDEVAVVDLLGRGTGCLVWSTPLPTGGSQLRYVDLMAGGKPHLLSEIRNSLGSVTTLEYTASTELYRADAAAGTPWVTRLPFPVQCLTRVRVRDSVTGAEQVTGYAYHHGYYDHAEREFRGFARVEQTDAESFTGDGDLPPVLTVQWYHTGLDPARGDLADLIRPEFVVPARLPAPAVPAGLAGAELREAYRALRGQALRTEVYALDAASGERGAPYRVTEVQPVVVRLRGRGEAAHAIFAVYSGQKLDTYYERDLTDPRTTHELTLEVDEFVTMTAVANVAYPRQRDTDIAEQRTGSVLGTRRSVVHRDDETSYRVGALVAAVTYDITGLSLLTLVAPAAVRAALDTAEVIDYRARPDPLRQQRRVVEQVRVGYLLDDLTGLAPAGEIGVRALIGRTTMQALTPAVIAGVYGDRVEPAALTAAGYLADPDGSWWLLSSRPTYDPSRFFVVVAITDPFGHVSTMEYDATCLAATAVTDAAGNTTTAEFDYRVVAPYRITDANGDATEAAFDALGRVAGTASGGDSLDGFVADLPAAVNAEHIDHPRRDPGQILGAATTRIVYDPDRVPAVAYQISRERHRDPASPVQHLFVYADGHGREVMRKTGAEPGAAPWRDAAGALQPPRHTADRWVGTGRTIRNNKSLPVRQYEPFFDDSPRYVDEAELVRAGVTAVIRYDPVGRPIRTDHPDGSYETVRIRAWSQTVADRDDTVADSAWFIEQSRPTADPLAARTAATVRATQAGTPGIQHLDPLGHIVRTDADAGTGTTFQTRTSYDVEGNLLLVVDPRGVPVQRAGYDLLGNAIEIASADAGAHQTLFDALGQPVLSWTARGMRIAHGYDSLHRPQRTVVRAGGVERLVGMVVYGEAAPLPADEIARRRLRGRAYQEYDGAGIATTEEYDAHGRPRVVTRTVFRRHEPAVDWADPPELGEAWTSVTEHDALGRAVSQTAPDGDVVEWGYNLAGLLATVVVTGGGRRDTYVSAISYDAKGQRRSISYGNGAVCRYDYDPATFRLTRLRTTRPDRARLQDLRYYYDPMGNITHLVDGAQSDVYFRGTVATASAEYTYDTLYRLVRATGREHIGQATDPDQSSGLRPYYDHSDAPRLGLPHPHDGAALRPYTQTFTYDAGGNLTVLHHEAGSGTWTRDCGYDDASNRLLRTSLPGGREGSYGYDEHGNLTAMPHLDRLDWDYADRLAAVELPGGGVEYGYDATGQRVRVVVGAAGDTVEERIYLGTFEIQRTFSARGELVSQWHTLHVMDANERIALRETKTVDTRDPTGLGRPVTRYQLANLLGSACLELAGDDGAPILSYEEYYPYGATSYQAGPSLAQVSRKRYRYGGKERDRHTGFSYHGARYYASWLGRWTAPDPAGLADGPNRYAALRGDPIRHQDPDGRTSIPPEVQRFLNVLQGHYATAVADVRKAYPKLSAQEVGKKAGAVMERMLKHAFGEKVVEQGYGIALQQTREEVLKGVVSYSRQRADAIFGKLVVDFKLFLSSTRVLQWRVFTDVAGQHANALVAVASEGWAGANLGARFTVTERRTFARAATYLAKLSPQYFYAGVVKGFSALKSLYSGLKLNPGWFVVDWVIGKTWDLGKAGLGFDPEGRQQYGAWVFRISPETTRAAEASREARKAEQGRKEALERIDDFAKKKGLTREEVIERQWEVPGNDDHPKFWPNPR